MPGNEFTKQEEEELKPLSRNAKIILIIGSLFAISTGLSVTFLNVFLWKSQQDFIMIGTFNLFHYLFTLLAFILGGWFMKNKNASMPLKMGVIFHAVFFLSILLMNKNAPRFIIPLGIGIGVASGLYWVSFNTLSLEVTTRFNRDTFNSYAGMVLSLSGMLAPLISSYIIISFQKNHGISYCFHDITAPFYYYMDNQPSFEN